MKSPGGHHTFSCKFHDYWPSDCQLNNTISVTLIHFLVASIRKKWILLQNRLDFIFFIWREGELRQASLFQSCFCFITRKLFRPASFHCGCLHSHSAFTFILERLTRESYFVNYCLLLFKVSLRKQPPHIGRLSNPGERRHLSRGIWKPPNVRQLFSQASSSCFNF